MKNKVMKVYGTAVKNIDRKVLSMKIKAENRILAQKEGNNWIDVALMALIGLGLAVLFKDKLGDIFATMFAKIQTQINLW